MPEQGLQLSLIGDEMTFPTFAELLDIKQIKRLMEAHFQVTRMCTAILDREENVLVAVGWQDLCCSFHRAHPVASIRCRESDAYIKAHIHDSFGDYLDYRCRNGLRDLAMPIIIEGRHLATFFIGQFFYEGEKPDLEFFREQAKTFGFEEAAFLDAVERVPIRSREEVRSIMEYYSELVKFIAGLGLSNLELAREVEERKKAETNASFFRTLIEYTRDPVYVLDPDAGYRIVYVNQAACAHFGMTPEKMMTMRIPDWDPVFDMDKIDSMREEMKRLGRSARFETLHRLASGEVVPVEVTANSLVHDGKEYSAGYFYDISERKKIEEALKESERNLIEAQRIARVGNWSCDMSGKILSLSAECKRILGRDPKALSGRVDALLNMVRPEDRESVRHAVEKIIGGGPPCSFECGVIRPDGGEVIVHVSGETVLDESGKPLRLMGTIQDITEQRRLRDSLREKDVLLLQQNRLAAMGEMINYIAHQWRQPLNTINLLVQSMRDDFHEGIIQREDIDRIVDQIMGLITHMSSTINDFRDFFKTEKEEEQFDLKEITRKAFSFIAESLKANRIKFGLKADDVLMIEGYPNEYAHVLLNILNNAREVLVERDVPSPEIEVCIFREGERAVVTIADNAGGIAPEVIGRVFDYSFTTKEHGSGIGLYMSKTIIERRMKGSISVKNVPGGTIFSIELRLASSP